MFILIFSALGLIPYSRVHGKPLKVSLPSEIRHLLLRFGIYFNPPIRVSSDEGDRSNFPPPESQGYLTEDSRTVELQQRKVAGTSADGFTSISLN